MRYSLSRVLVSISAVFFACIGIAVWVAPDLIAHRLGLEAIRDSGRIALRADMGGLFVGLAIMCAAAVATRRRLGLKAAGGIVSPGFPAAETSLP